MICNIYKLELKPACDFNCNMQRTRIMDIETLKHLLPKE